MSLYKVQDYIGDNKNGHVESGGAEFQADIFNLQLGIDVMG